MTRRDWANWIGRAVLELGIGLLFLFCAMAYGQAPFVNLTGQMTGPNGLPVANNVLTFKPTQMFFVGGTNTTQQVGNLFGNSAPTGTCLIQAQLYTETGVTPQLLHQCQYGTWVLVSGAGGSGCLGGNSIANGCTGATTSQGAATNIVDNNVIAPAKIGTAYFYCDQPQFAGADYGAKMASCFAALYAAGGGTADSTNFSCPTTGTCNIGTASLQCGDNVHHVTWKTPWGYITRGTVNGKSTQIIRNSYCNVQAPGSKGSTIIDGPADGVAVQQGQVSGGVHNADWSGINVQSTGTITPGSVAFQFSGVTPGYPFNNSPGTATPGNIGRDPVYFAGGYFPGHIAQFAVYNKALTGTQAANHYTVGSSGSGYESTVSADGPISYYPLKETSGTTANDLIGSRNGTYTGGVTLNNAPGIPGDTSCGGVCNAPLFDDSTGYVNLPSFTWIPSGDWTVEGWYNTNNAPGTGFKQMWGFSSSTSDATWFTDDGSTGGTLALTASYSGRVDVLPDLTENAWVYVAVVKQSSIVTIYINGVAAKSGTDSLDSVIKDALFSGADIGQLFNSIGGCTCYNKLSNVDAGGASFAAVVQNSSGYASGVNSDQWISGKLSGPVAILAQGAGDFTFQFVDEESNLSPNGAVLFANPDFFNQGSGYAVGDIGTISGGSGTAIYKVTAVSGGAVTAVSIVPTVGNAVPSGSGTGYANAPSVATTATTGGGTGLQLDIITQAYNILMGGTNVLTPYEEAGGGNYVCGTGNTLMSPNSWLGSQGGNVGGPSSMFCTGWEVYSGNTPYGGPFQNQLSGQNTANNALGLAPRYNGAAGWISPYISFFGRTFNGSQNDPYLSKAYRSKFTTDFAPVNLWPDGPAWGGQYNGQGYGHGTPWKMGLSEPLGGTAATGRTTYSGIATPAAPTCSATGGTGTNYLYAVVAVDQNGGVTLPSSFTTVSGAASLASGTKYNTCTYPWVDGAVCEGLIVGDTTHGLPYSNVTFTTVCNGFTSAGYNGGTMNVDGSLTSVDFGQPRQTVTLPGRNTTGDFLVGGNPPAVTNASMTVGQAACVKAVGPPVVLGYCSTTPTSGACTCN